MKSGDVWKVGDFHEIIGIVDDPDFYRVIRLRGGHEFPCTQAWVEEQKPIVGSFVTIDPETGRRIVVCPVC